MKAALPYAAAAFSYAENAGEESLRRWARFFAAVAESEDDIARTARAARGGQRALAEAIVAAAATTGDAETDGAMANFLCIVAAAGRMEILGEIARGFAALHSDAAGVLDVRVETAHPMALKARSEFDRALVQWTGKKVRAAYSENSGLLGGVRVYVNDNVLDASIRGRLDRLATAIY